MNANGRSGELKGFLRAMRARVNPRDAGLDIAPGTRRKPGLRRDEAAALANVGITWYTALETGKDIRVSAKLLDRVATALRLSAEERDYLFVLARPRGAPAPMHDDIAALRPAIDGFTVGPAFISDRFWNVRACNALANRVYGHDQAREKNLLARMLFEPDFRALHDDWEAVARRMVAIMHLAYGRTPDDADGVATVERLSASSPRFVAWWSDYRLRDYEPARGTIVHPVLGPLRLQFTSFVASAMAQRDSALMVVLQSPLDDVTRARLGGPFA